MVKSPEQLKNMTEEYIKITGAKYKETTDIIKEKNEDLDWQYVSAQSIHITMMKSRPDRVLIHDAIGFDETIQKGLNEIGTTDPEFINSINELIMMKDCTHDYIKNKDGIITGINLKTYIDSEEFDRPKFFRAWDKLIAIQIQLAKKIGLKLNPKQTKVTDTETADKSMYG